MKNRKAADADALVSTGVPGLDDILHGGLTAHRLYLVEGDPGAGKTTLGLQFLLAGKARGEKGIYVSLSETRAELVAVGQSHGFDMDGVAISEMAPTTEMLRIR